MSIKSHICTSAIEPWRNDADARYAFLAGCLANARPRTHVLSYGKTIAFP